MRSRAGFAGLAALAAIVVLLTVLGRPGADYRHSDWFQFWAAPRLLLEGADPYDPAAWADIYRREATAPIATPPVPYRSIYPPWTLVLLLPLAALPIDVAAAIWLTTQLAVVALALRALVVLVHGGRREAVLLFGFATAFQPLWLMVVGGNVTGFLLGLFVSAAAAVLAGRPVRTGAGLALLAVKPHLFTVAGPALLAATGSRHRLTLITSAAATGLALVGMTLPFGPGLIREWLDSAFDLQVSTGSNATAWTLGRVLPGGAPVGPLFVAAAVAALVAWWRTGEHPAVTRIAAAVAVSVFVAPHGWSYDQLLLLVPLAAILGHAAALRGARRAIALTAAAAIAGLVPWLLYAVAFQRAGEEWGATTPILFFGLLVLIERWAHERSARET